MTGDQSVKVLERVVTSLEEFRSTVVPVGDSRSSEPALSGVDARRRAWIAVPVDVAFSAAGIRLQEQFGPAGLTAWILLLAAAKRSPTEGRVSFASESEAWQIIGILEPDRLGFTLKQFLDTLGTLKQTKRTLRGRVTNVQITRWEELQRPRSGARNAYEKPHENKSEGAPDQDQDYDIDKDPDAGLAMAIEEARGDPIIFNPVGAGRYRYRNNPHKYDRLVERQQTAERADQCTRCDMAGFLWYRPDGTQTTRDDLDAQTSERCSHALPPVVDQFESA